MTKKQLTERQLAKEFIIRRTKRKIAEAGGNPRSIATQRAEKTFRKSS